MPRRNRARSRHRLDRPQPDRPRVQGLAQGRPPRRPRRRGRHRPPWTRSRRSTRRLVDDLYLGCAEPWGEHGSNMARVVAVLAGYDHLPGATVNRFCASSVQTTRMAFHAIKAGEGDIFICGGVECVSPLHRLRRRRRRPRPTGRTRGSPRPAPAARGPPQTTTPGPTRARTACCPTSTSRWARPPRTSRRLRGISRERQDEWGVTSQNRAEKAIADGFFAREITPVTTARRHRRQHGRRPPRRASRWRRCQGLQPGVPRAGHGHRRQLLPAQRRRRRRSSS